MLRKIFISMKKWASAGDNQRQAKRRLTLESLETRNLFAGLPFGATSADTAEYFLGRIAVTPVFLESNGQIDPSTENWTSEQKASVLGNIQTGLNWWKQLLATKSSVQKLDFVIDTTYVNSPAPTPYEPIARISNAYSDWVSQFLVDAGFSQSTQLDTNVRAFNNSQRLKLNTDWSFTIFVVNSQNDADGSFAAGGSFDRAFAFAGGLFEVVPSTRQLQRLHTKRATCFGLETNTSAAPIISRNAVTITRRTLTPSISTPILISFKRIVSCRATRHSIGPFKI